MADIGSVRVAKATPCITSLGGFLIMAVLMCSAASAANLKLLFTGNFNGIYASVVRSFAIFF